MTDPKPPRFDQSLIQRALGTDNQEFGYFSHQIGYGHYISEECDEAVQVLNECARVRRTVLGDDDGWGKPEQADEWR